ncbi:hypothetical protein SEA_SCOOBYDOOBYDOO_29 [Mycobacterium phage ScoobyDoobyDoo]|nr:hypothetical protein SEA_SCOOBYDOOBYDOO_29 [Mycobacterium phage ScoobyDoobyDoo]
MDVFTTRTLGETAFDVNHCMTNSRGSVVFFANTHLRSAGGNGRYQIEKFGARLWVLTHHQVIDGGERSIVRRLGQFPSKAAAVREAERDVVDLEINILDHLVRA